MLGGGAFIYHSRQEKYKTSQQQAFHQQSVQAQRQQELSKKQIAQRQQKYAQLLSKRKQLEEETHSKRVEDRTSSRKSLLGSFLLDSNKSSTKRDFRNR